MRRGLRQRLPLLLLLAVSGLMFTWQLDESGYANVYYSAAAQAGSVSWKALFFGSLDGANALTVDKPPLALWPMGLSVRVFGLSSWSILLPQAVEGVAAVGLLYATVRRTTGQTWVAVLAGGLFAITPVSVLVFRYNIPDAMLTMLLLGAAYATIRALEGRHDSWWLVLAGALAGLGFLTKMLEAWLVLPALWLTYLVYGHGTFARRIGRLALSVIAMLAAAGWWIAIVETWPISKRPFIGGSPTNSVLQLALGYNGLGRLTGSTGTTSASEGLGATNIARIGRVDLGAEITWLLPAAIVLAVAAWRLSRRRDNGRAIRSAVLMWTLWLGVVCVTFALMAGIFHSYYTVILAPAIAALVALGTWLAWERRDVARVRQLLCATILVTTLVSGSTVAAVGFELKWWFPVVVAAGIGATFVVLRTSADRRVKTPWAVLALAATLVGPVLFSMATIRSPHVGSGPMAGPGRAATTTELLVPSAYAGFFGAYVPIPDAVAAALKADAHQYRWVAATLGAKSAAAYQLTVAAPVLAIGGYKGTDPAPTLQQFIAMVGDRQVHWFIPDGTYGPAGTQIEAWVQSQFEPTMIGGHAMYDLSQGAGSATGPTRPTGPAVLAALG